LFTGTGFPPGNTVTLSVNSTDIETQSADSEGTVSFTFISDTLSTGSHTAVLSSGDLSASMVFTVLNDNEDPGDAEGEDPDDTDGKDPDDTDGKDPDDTDGKDPDRLDTLPETGIGSDGLVALGALLILSAAAILGARVRA